MRIQDQLVRSTQKSLDDICRSAMAVPEDKQDWSPGGAARSTLAQMQEVSMGIAWLKAVVRDGKAPELSDHDRLQMKEAAEQLTSVDKCIEAARQQVIDWCQLISDFPDERLLDEVVMPFGGGMRMTLTEVLGLPAWNMVYHLGQINMIQLMLGDRVMH
jgi:uncharacterized damage-inducible protein DinB